MSRKGANQISKQTPPPTADEDKELSTLSVRFTDEQRELLVKAAEFRGWKPTALIRTAALERAAHIVNTGQLTKFDFKGLASQISEQLFQWRTVKHRPTLDESEQFYREAECEGDPHFDVPVEPLSVDTLVQLKNAARLGGAEFLAAIIDFAESLTASQRPDLPDPIDPGKIDA